MESQVVHQIGKQTFLDNLIRFLINHHQLKTNLKRTLSRSGMPGGKNVIVEPHQRLPGVFIARGKEDALVTRNLIPGDSVYGEKRISVETDGQKIEYRIWNPFRSKLG